MATHQSHIPTVVGGHQSKEHRTQRHSDGSSRRPPFPQASYGQGSPSYYSNQSIPNSSQSYYQIYTVAFMHQHPGGSMPNGNAYHDVSGSTGYDLDPANGYQTLNETAIPYHHQQYWHGGYPPIHHPRMASPYGTVSSATTANRSGQSRHGQRMVNSMTQPCGPPIKPKQSGFALWVGNLPPGVAVVDIKDHFAQGARDDIQSVRLISRSNCAFVNYRTETSSLAAAQRFDGARMLGFRLSIRVRNTTVASSEAKTPHALSGTSKTPVSARSSNGTVDALSEAFSEQKLTPKPTRFFILKSMTNQDIETSIKSGRWSTQPHNEDPLNRAFKSADQVYLIFSVNQSGEYAGYARMRSAVESESVMGSDDTAPDPGLQQPEGAKRPYSCSCAATEWAPPGRIVIDEARSTIFWEATKPVSVKPQDHDRINGQDIKDSSSIEPVANRVRSFKVEWISTQRLPFFRVSGLRNPMNSNLQVKIARDGQEVEPSVGKQLIDTFTGVTNRTDSNTSVDHYSSENVA